MTIVIPIHLPEPDVLGRVSLSQTLAVLNRYRITFMAPTQLDVSWYENFCRGRADIAFERFEWQGREQFSELMIAPLFYERFLDYEYILICHLDAFVFRDELADWCNKGYDYLPSVIYNADWAKGMTASKRKTFVLRAIRKLTGIAPSEYFGNGGFSLRKVRSFHDVTSRFRLFTAMNRLMRRLRRRGFLEDIFVMRNFPRLSKQFKLAPKSVAQLFGAEYVNYPENELPFDRHEKASLPFGIHGWIQFRPDYWKPCIRSYGYEIPH
ncbi:MAG: DUF5672 family protein [Burkholderiaceae bacterium]